MTISGWRFTAKLWPTVIAALVIITMIMLGNWQISRAREKETRQEQLNLLSNQPIALLPETPIELKNFQFRQVEVRGTYVPSHTIYLDNKIHRGVIGYQVITPVKIGRSSTHVLVNRGWVAAGRSRSDLPKIFTPTGQVIISGIAHSPTQKTLELSVETVAGKVWENLNLEHYRETTKLVLQPILILQQDDLKDGLVRQWDRPDSGSARNFGYAFQWFSMALAVLLLYLVLSVKRDNPKNT